MLVLGQENIVEVPPGRSPSSWTPLFIAVADLQPFAAMQVINEYIERLFSIAETPKQKDAITPLYIEWSEYFKAKEEYKEGYKTAEVDEWVKRYDAALLAGWGDPALTEIVKEEKQKKDLSLVQGLIAGGVLLGAALLIGKLTAR